MKKIIIKTLGFIFTSVLLTSCGGNNPHTHSWSNEWTCNNLEHWHACSECIETKDKATHIDTDNDGICDVCNHYYHEPTKPTTLEIVNQPQNATINYGDGISMTVKVNNPELVKSYQWYNGLFENGQLVESVALLGSKAKTDTYSLKTFLTYYPDANFGFQCKITDINGNEIESNWAQVFVNETEQDIPHIVLGDYLITPGKIFNLASTPYGSGTITVNETCDHFVFENVMLSNQFFDSNFEGMGFRYLDYGPNFKDVTFEFKGVNTFQNFYWDDERAEGGSIFQYQVLGLDPEEEKPTATFTGSGSLSFYGGSYGIVCEYANMIQDIDINFYSQPGRRQSGIKCENYTLAKDRLFKGSLTGKGVDVNNASLEEGSKFYLDLGTAYSGMMGSNSAIDATDDININDADIKINSLFNMKKQLEDDIHLVSVGILSMEGEVSINNSNVEISALQYNDDLDIEETFTSATAVAGISAQFLKMNNSNLKIDIQGTAIEEARAINTQGFSGTNCLLNLDVAGRTAGGIECYGTIPEDLAPVSFENTDININLHNYLLDTFSDVEILPWDNSAIYGTSFDFKSSNQNTITINTNGGPTICLRTRIEDDRDKRIEPHDDYNEHHLQFENVSYVSSKTINYNEKSYNTAYGWNFVYETLYEKVSPGNYNYIDNVTITYTTK